jgi:hypothetical protein
MTDCKAELDAIARMTASAESVDRDTRPRAPPGLTTDRMVGRSAGFHAKSDPEL